MSTGTNERAGSRGLRFDPEGQRAVSLSESVPRASYSWFRGAHTNFNPTVEALNKPGAVEDYVLKGWAPPEPLIGPDTKIVAFGSCFAANITEWLSKRNFSVLTRKDGEYADAYIVRFGEGMVNSSVLRQQFEWAFEGRVFNEELWHGYDAQAFGYDESVRLRTKAVFDSADVFIITLGLSEVWYDEVTGGVFWRAVPADKYDPSRHKFRVLSVAENKENIRAIVDLIAKHKPGAKLVFTLSPIPLVATFRPVSCITANAVSKASLRVSLDEVLRELSLPWVYYWPSYEIVMDVFGNRWKDDRRHIRQPILSFIMTLFENVWCHGSTPDMSINEAWIRARAATGAIPVGIMRAIDGDDSDRLGLLMSRLTKKRASDEIALIDELVREVALAKPTSNVALWSKTRHAA